MLQGRSDLTALWDLRMRPERRGEGIGSALFHTAKDWARHRGYTQLKIETQNVNATACHFYIAMGCTLGGINRFASTDMPGEVQLLWCKGL
jgi:GNAT superfamily N-acetyltransferase